MAAQVKLAASILAADFSRLGERVAEAEKAGADRIHADVMDGHFVPNISLGVPVVRSLRAMTSLSLETHLMITDPDRFLDPFAEAGCDALPSYFSQHSAVSCASSRQAACSEPLRFAP
jgi:ribulose-phosphate 3-epimerase